jgi:hypothetical protein
LGKEAVNVENKERECGKEREERYKRLQAAENMGFAQRHGATEADKC